MRFPSLVSVGVLLFYVGQAFLTTACEADDPLKVEINGLDATVSWSLKTKQKLLCSYTSEALYDYYYWRDQIAVAAYGLNYRPVDFGGSHVTRKTLEYKRSSDTEWTVVPFTSEEYDPAFDIVIPAVNGSEKISGLQGDTEYDFRLSTRITKKIKSSLGSDLNFKNDHTDDLYKDYYCTPFSGYRNPLYLLLPVKFGETWNPTSYKQFREEGEPKNFVEGQFVTTHVDDDVFTKKATPRSRPGDFAITSVEAQGTSNLLIKWSVAEKTDKYQVCFSTNKNLSASIQGGASCSGGVTKEQKTVDGQTEYSDTIPVPPPKETYYIVVLAKNKYYDTDKTATFTSELSYTSAEAAPGVFAINSATPSSQQVTLSWGASTGAASYTVLWGTETAKYTGTKVGISGTSTTISNLTNNQPYFFMVVANNGGGTKNATAEVSATPASAPPGAFTITSATPGNAKVTLVWGSASNATSYAVTYGTVSGSHTTPFASCTTSPCDVTGLANGTTYYFMVTATNGGGSTPATLQASATPLGAPGAFTITSATPGDGKVTLVWGSAANAASYAVTYGTVSGVHSTSFPACTVSPCDVTGLSNGPTYYFMVTATNVGGSTPATAQASAAPNSGVLPGVFAINSPVVRNGRIVLDWTASSGATSYTVKYGTVTGPVYLNTFSTNATSPTTVTGLSNDQQYFFMVTAVIYGGGSRNATSEVSATPLNRNVMFISTNTMFPNIGFGGVPTSGFQAAAIADTLCAGDASLPLGGGTYKALLAGSTRVACTSANCVTGGATENADWVLAASQAYMRPDGTLIGTTTANAIFTFNLTNAISATAAGPMTGLNADWTTGNNCTDWSAGSGDFVTADATATNSSAINSADVACPTQRPLICVEQPPAKAGKDTKKKPRATAG